MSEPVWVPLGASAQAGTELAYAERTATLSVTAASEATALAVVTAPAVSFDGLTVVEILFSAAFIGKGASWTRCVLFDGETSLGTLVHSDGTTNIPAMGRRRLTPSAGSHVYSIRAYVDAGTGAVGAGAGGAGVYVPACMSVRKAA
jgi:hypothetical protein